MYATAFAILRAVWPYLLGAAFLGGTYYWVWNRGATSERVNTDAVKQEFAEYKTAQQRIVTETSCNGMQSGSPPMHSNTNYKRHAMRRSQLYPAERVGLLVLALCLSVMLSGCLQIVAVKPTLPDLPSAIKAQPLPYPQPPTAATSRPN